MKPAKFVSANLASVRLLFLICSEYSPHEKVANTATIATAIINSIRVKAFCDFNLKKNHSRINVHVCLSYSGLNYEIHVLSIAHIKKGSLNPSKIEYHQILVSNGNTCAARWQRGGNQATPFL